MIPRHLMIGVSAMLALALGMSVYVWHMRPLYHILPIDPRWVRWLVSLRLLPQPVMPLEQA